MTVRYIIKYKKYIPTTYMSNIIARNICTILSRNLPIATKLFSLGTLPKKSDPEAYFLAHCQEIPARGRYLFILHVQNILHSTYLCTSNMPDQQKFAEFYSTIRSHFSSNTWDYEKFKNNKNNRSKVEFLMCHEASALKSEKNSNLGKASKININVFRKNSNRSLCKDEKNYIRH